MKPFTYHNHTTFCDGKSTVEEMILSAIEKGCDGIGFSAHSYTAYDGDYCLKEGKTEEYCRTVKSLAEKYKDKIDVFLGIELDIFSNCEFYNQDYQYKIGSVHSVTDGENYYTVDASEKQFLSTVETLYGGDFYAYCDDYFKLLARTYEITKCDIVGHIDLVAKFNEGGKYFDESNERYLRSARAAIRKLASDGVIFEINTGAISRGYRKTPYPSRPLMRIIREEGGRVTYSSDCHAAENVLCEYQSAVDYAKEFGFEGFMKLDGEKFKFVPFG